MASAVFSWSNAILKTLAAVPTPPYQLAASSPQPKHHPSGLSILLHNCHVKNKTALMVIITKVPRPVLGRCGSKNARPPKYRALDD
ncbi:hypothetical protein HDK90DRAFT_477964 [Phyllosticta capitalensis]|uniref:Uncharacterized protein n=1 Tax=Phyllosticta capitalensis TaxID=121624 RepID=A0ABR1Z0T5_9PEZI